MAGCRRNPSKISFRGWADRRRIAASLVVAVLLRISTSSSSLLALLAARPSATMGAFCSVLYSVTIREDRRGSARY